MHWGARIGKYADRTLRNPFPISKTREVFRINLFSSLHTQKMLIRNGMRKICKSTSHCWGLIREHHENSDCRAIFTGKSYCRFPANLMLHRFFFLPFHLTTQRQHLKDAGKKFLFCLRENKEIKITLILEEVLK